MPLLHAHVQVEYSYFKDREEALKNNEYPSAAQSTESLIGFDPCDPDGRKLAHDMLDEYLDYLAEFKKFRNKNGFEIKKSYTENEANRFIVFGNLDVH